MQHRNIPSRWNDERAANDSTLVSSCLERAGAHTALADTQTLTLMFDRQVNRPGPFPESTIFTPVALKNPLTLRSVLTPLLTLLISHV
jgi:hypothetical protein